jgi:hypothetical protein
LLGSAYTAFAAICVFVVDVYFRNARYGYEFTVKTVSHEN